ncbi:MAG: hypothetical protein JW774_11180 [Candidatus Aureabacteria bacterium]|nr:hypothetical protein [Candidatus Auribacterota bacterium]
MKWTRTVLNLVIFTLILEASGYAQTVEDIKRKVGYKPRLHVNKNATPIKGEYSVEDVDLTAKEHVTIRWISPDADDITLAAAFLLTKSGAEDSFLIHSQRRFRASQGLHQCYIHIPEYYINLHGNIKKYHIEIIEDGEKKADNSWPEHIESKANLITKPWYENNSDLMLMMYRSGNDILYNDIPPQNPPSQQKTDQMKNELSNLKNQLKKENTLKEYSIIALLASLVLLLIFRKR